MSGGHCTLSTAGVGFLRVEHAAHSTFIAIRTTRVGSDGGISTMSFVEGRYQDGVALDFGGDWGRPSHTVRSLWALRGACRRVVAALLSGTWYLRCASP